MLIDPVERLWMFSHWLTLKLFSLKWHSLQRSPLTVVNCCAGDPVGATELKWIVAVLKETVVVLKRSVVVWSGPPKVEVLFVVKWHWRCVWVVGTKWYQVELLRFSCYFMLILKWSVCTEVNLNLSWSWQFVSWDIRWATSWIWGLPCPNRWIEVLVCGVKILWLTHKSWQIWRSQILNLVLKVP